VQGFITGFSELDYSMMKADMRLDSITVVPEPGVLSLLVLGGLSWFICVGRGAYKTTVANAGTASRFHIGGVWLIIAKSQPSF
jgi:hypothetical protein